VGVLYTAKHVMSFGENPYKLCRPAHKNTLLIYLVYLFTSIFVFWEMTQTLYFLSWRWRQLVPMKRCQWWEKSLTS